MKLIFSEIRQCLLKKILLSLAKASKYTPPYVKIVTQCDQLRSPIFPSNGTSILCDSKIFCKFYSTTSGDILWIGKWRSTALVGLGRVFPRHLSTTNSNEIRKSQIAVEFAYNLLERYPETLIFWVFGGSKERFEQDYLGIARRLQLPCFHGSTVDVLALVKTELEKRSNWAMIIDNAGDSTTYGEHRTPIIQKRLSKMILMIVEAFQNIFHAARMDSFFIRPEQKTMH